MTTSINGTVSWGALGLWITHPDLPTLPLGPHPHLVVLPRTQDVDIFMSFLKFLDSPFSCSTLPHFDVSPYSGLYPSPRLLSERIHFFHRAQEARPGEIFVSSIGALMQNCIPYQVLKANSFKYSLGDLFPLSTKELDQMGYQPVPVVEDVGQYAQRGGILDLFSPAQNHPIRLELSGNTIESLRTINLESQLTREHIESFIILPCHEVTWGPYTSPKVLDRFLESLQGRDLPPYEREDALRCLSRETFFPGIDFLLPYFYEKPGVPLDHFNQELNVWFWDPDGLKLHGQEVLKTLQEEYENSVSAVLHPKVSEYFTPFKLLAPQTSSSIHHHFFIHPLSVDNTDGDYQGAEEDPTGSVFLQAPLIKDLGRRLSQEVPGSRAWTKILLEKITQWEKDKKKIFIGVQSSLHLPQLRAHLNAAGIPWVEVGDRQKQKDFQSFWKTLSASHQNEESASIFLVPHPLAIESFEFPSQGWVFLRSQDLLHKQKFGQRSIGVEHQTSSLSPHPSTTQVPSSLSLSLSSGASKEFHRRAQQLHFGELSPGDRVVHLQHGVGIYEGLRIMELNGTTTEMIQIQYRDADRLYLPVYRIHLLQKYTGGQSTTILDRLGGDSWEKKKTKVIKHLRDIALDLLQHYAQREAFQRDPLIPLEMDSHFASDFPYEETRDQLRAIEDLMKDFASHRPMDRLICGDVGFGKTEVAMRAAFLMAHTGRKQVGVLAPTTVLTFQHYETFKKRFAPWSSEIEVRVLNRFIPPAEIKKTLQDLGDGRVQILIGTHRLLSRDVVFQNLGLLIVDEEHKFGVVHKEKIKKMKLGVDTLTLSATPIPRTLNMSFAGLRDLSLINTPPQDRLPTRTFIVKWNRDTLRKAITNEIKRNGQVYFIHNRIESLPSIFQELKDLLPPDVRIQMAHGQMPEDTLERTIMAFFHHEIDILVCTAIVESGMDVPRANTMIIDQAHRMGLNQLYQLRGRVGRSKERAYCYLVIPQNQDLDPEAQERLRVIQENTALGSGITVAQYDLEMRGAGDLLGENQSGHMNSVGQELYMELLGEVIQDLQGGGTSGPSKELEPEINLRIPALIPDAYMPDVRLRLSYYKTLGGIQSESDLDSVTQELEDQFGPLPEETANLMGVMLIRNLCKLLKVKDLSAGLKSISLSLSETTPLPREILVKLAFQENKKYSLTPNGRLNIRMNEITWPRVLEELSLLGRLSTTTSLT